MPNYIGGKLKIGVTMGCPAGIGPEIVVKAVSMPWPEYVQLVVLGDVKILSTTAQQLGLSSNWKILHSPEEIHSSNTHVILNLSHLSYVRPGRPTLETARAMVRYIKEGVKLCQQKVLCALVTSPISKAALRLAGESYPGHTEMLASLTGAKEYVMAFYGKRLKIVLVTIHVALKDVARLLSKDAILKAARLAKCFLKRDLGIKDPKLALAGLNPHASEGGLFGDEEEEILIPAVKAAQQQGIALFGPYPSDSLFFRAVQGEFDLVVSLYHDQGLIPFKLLHFRDGVNLTLGLPIIRTSVDHGTAYDIAGKNKADAQSLIKAIELAVKMAQNRSNL